MINKVISEVGKAAKVDKVVDIGKKLIDYESGKKELEEQITIEAARHTADTLSMEFSISLNHSVPYTGDEINVQLYPTESTYAMIDRWKEVHEINSNIPYPEKHIASQNWPKVNDFYYKHNTLMLV